MSFTNKIFLEKAEAFIGNERFKTDLIAGGHSLIADETLEQGGQDKGPNPFALLLAGLASCTVSTLRGFADRKKWPLEQAHVEVLMSKVKEDKREWTQIEKKVNFVGNLSSDQQQTLLQVAAACPVNRLLEDGVFIDTTLAHE